MNMETEHLFHGRFFAEETRRAVTLTPDLLLVERVLRQARGQPSLSAELAFEVYIDIDTGRVRKNQSTNNREEALKPAVSLAALLIH